MLNKLFVADLQAMVYQHFERLPMIISCRLVGFVNLIQKPNDSKILMNYIVTIIKKQIIFIVILYVNRMMKIHHHHHHHQMNGKTKMNMVNYNHHLIKNRCEEFVQLAKNKQILIEFVDNFLMSIDHILHI